MTTTTTTIENNFTTSQLIEIYPHGYPGLSPDWNLQATMGMTIPLSQFSKIPRSFSDLNPTSPFHPVLESLFQVLDRQFIKGTVYENAQHAVFPYHCAEGVPKFVSTVEILVKKMEPTMDQAKVFEKNNLWGYRIWLFRLDASLDLKTSYDEFAQCPKKADRLSPVLKSIISPYDLEQKIWKPFSSYYEQPVRIAMGDNEMPVERTVISDPEEILSPKRMFDKHFLTGLCPEQSDQSRYFNLVQGPNAFKGSFPHRDFIFRISHDYVNETFYRPIPNSLFLSVSDNQKKIDQLQKKLNEQRMLLEDDDMFDEALSEIKNLEKKIQNLEDDNNRLLRSISDKNMTPQYIFANNILEILALVNELIQLRVENIRRTHNLRQSFNMEDPIFTEKIYLERIQMLQKLAQVVYNSKLIPPMLKTWIELFLMANPGEQSGEERCVYSDSTCFSNMIIAMNHDFDKVCKLDTNFQLFWIVWLVCLNSLYFVLALRANILISGDAGRGKSYVFKMLEKLTPPGAIFSVSHQTANAHNTSQGMMDVMEYQDEGNMLNFGMDLKGKVQHANTEFKQLLVDQIKQIYAFKVNNEGKRESEYTIARHTTSVAISTNEGHPHRSTPAMSRFIHYIVTEQHRADRKSTATSMDSEDSVPLAVKEATKSSYHLHYFYQYIVEKAIEAAVLPDVDMSVFDHSANIVFDELRKSHIPLPTHRTITKFKFLCRSLTILYAVHMEYFSELGRHHRVDEEGNPKKFDFLSLMDVIKWLVCSQEIFVFVMTLLENEFCSVHDTSVIDAIKRLTKFPPSVEIKNGSCRFRQIEIEGTNEIGRDYNYIEMSAEAYRAVAASIQENIVPKPSIEDVFSTLTGLCSQTMEIYPKNIRRSKTNKSIEKHCCVCQEKLSECMDEKIKCDFCDRYRCNECEGMSCESQKRYFNKMVGKLDRCQNCSGMIPEMQIQESKCSQCKSSCHMSCMKVCSRSGCKRKTCGACKFQCTECNLFFHADCLRGHKDLIEDTNASTELVPAVIFDRFRSGKQLQSRISFCIDLFYKNHKSVLRRALKSSLEHRHMQEFKAITGFPYVTEKTLPHMLGNTYYHIFDVIDFQKNDHLHVLTNDFNFSKDEKTFQLRRLSEIQQEGFDENYTDPGRILDQDMDCYFMHLHFKKQGLRNEDSVVVIPNVTSKRVWTLRKTMECYKPFKNQIIHEEYPLAAVESCQKACKKKSRLFEEAKKGNAAFAPASDILLDKNTKTRKLDSMGSEIPTLASFKPSVDLGKYHPVEPDKLLELTKREIQEEVLRKKKVAEKREKKRAEKKMKKIGKSFDHMEIEEL